MEIKVSDIVKSLAEDKTIAKDEKELKEIIEFPFKYLKGIMDRGEDTEIRFTYFGVFRPIKSIINRVSNEKNKTK